MLPIKERHDDIVKRMRIHDSRRKLLEGELAALQAECEHPNMKSGISGNYDGSSESWTSCPDCGRHTSR